MNATSIPTATAASNKANLIFARFCSELESILFFTTVNQGAVIHDAPASGLFNLRCGFKAVVWRRRR